jgi:two-component system, OmpR family, sensor kinase
MTGTTTAMTGTTTEGVATPARRLREHARSVRTRITAGAVVVTAGALLAVGVTSYLVETNRVDDRIRTAISQEFAEFDNLEKDPETGRPFASAGRMVEVALQRNTPERTEVLLGYVPGKDWQTTSESRLSDLDRTILLDEIEQMRSLGGSGSVEAEIGEVVFGVKPVRDGGEEAAYVVAYLRDLEQAQVLDTMRTYGVIALLALVLVAIGAWLTAGRVLRPIRDLRDTALDITDTDLSRRIKVEGNDELADLAATFNAMLDRLEDSFRLQRRFLDDAGHELRTPITIVRGHLEVTDPGNPDDVAATRALVLDELDRMGRLVDDLIVLAKAGQPDFLHVTDVDAAALTDHVLEKVRALGERRWVLDDRAEWIVSADPQRITQALVQLAKNAVQHTHEGDEVAIGSAVGADHVMWWVRDTGPGVQRADAARIFDRFQRGHQAPGHDGSGLGLSIVRAIAQAHGGEVFVRSEPERGATFCLVLPPQPDAVRYSRKQPEAERQPL